MKEETKRYMIVEYAGTVQRVYDTKQQLEENLERIRKYNNRKTAKYICGNVDVRYIDGKYYMNVHLYNKLSRKCKISDIDNFTKNFSQTELEAFYAPNSVMKDGYESDINIAYMETPNKTESKEPPLLFGVKYIPVAYKDDARFFEEKFVSKSLRYRADNRDTGFFRSIANEFCQHHAVSKYVEELFIYCDRVDNQGYDSYYLYTIAMDLYKNLIYEREKDGSVTLDEEYHPMISHRRRRDFIFFIKNYNSRKKKSPFGYNGSIIRMKKDDLIRQREQLLQREMVKSLTIPEAPNKKKK